MERPAIRSLCVGMVRFFQFVSFFNLPSFSFNCLEEAPESPAPGV